MIAFTTHKSMLALLLSVKSWYCLMHGIIAIAFATCKNIVIDFTDCGIIFIACVIHDIIVITVLCTENIMTTLAVHSTIMVSHATCGTMIIAIATCKNIAINFAISNTIAIAFMTCKIIVIAFVYHRNIAIACATLAIITIACVTCRIIAITFWRRSSRLLFCIAWAELGSSLKQSSSVDACCSWRQRLKEPSLEGWHSRWAWKKVNEKGCPYWTWKEDDWIRTMLIVT